MGVGEKDIEFKISPVDELIGAPFYIEARIRKNCEFYEANKNVSFGRIIEGDFEIQKDVLFAAIASINRQIRK